MPCVKRWGLLEGSAAWVCPMCKDSRGVSRVPQIPRASRDTLNPKILLCSCRSLLSRVLFPAPDGPLRTTGLGPDIPVEKLGKLLVGPKDPSGWVAADTSLQLSPGIGQSWWLYLKPGYTFLRGGLPTTINTWLPQMSILTPSGKSGLFSAPGRGTSGSPPVSPGIMPQRQPWSGLAEPKHCSGNFH